MSNNKLKQASIILDLRDRLDLNKDAENLIQNKVLSMMLGSTDLLSNYSINTTDGYTSTPVPTLEDDLLNEAKELEDSEINVNSVENTHSDEIDILDVFNDYPENYVVKYHITGIENKVDGEWVYTGLQLVKIVYDYESTDDKNTSITGEYSNFRVVEEILVLVSCSGSILVDYDIIINSYRDILNKAVEETGNEILTRYKINNTEQLNKIIILHKDLQEVFETSITQEEVNS